MTCTQTTVGRCVQVHPAAQCDSEEELPPLANDCSRPEGGDMTVKAPEPYRLTVNNLPDENA